MQGENRYQFSQNMNTILKMRAFAAVGVGLFAAVMGMGVTSQAQNNNGPDPAGVIAARYGAAAPGSIDPTTGLPAADPSTQWKDPKWKDPDKALAEVSYDGVPIGEVARDLRKKFNDAFDIVVPNSWQSPNNPAIVTEPGNTQIRIQLKNVTASEVFNAMNLVFETENTPMHWELKMNGNRPMVVLRVFPGPLGPAPEQPRRHVFFVGELLGDEKTGGMTMEQLVKTISEVYEMSYGTSQGPISNHLQFHKQAQLLIAMGTNEELSFVSETLAALRQKIQHGPKLEPPKAESKPAREKEKGS